MQWELKDLFQFGVPTGLLVLLLWKVVPFMQDWLTKLLETFKDGFEKIELSAKESANLWRGEVSAIHKEDREDKDKDRELRHETNKVMQAYLSELQLTVEELRDKKDVTHLAEVAVNRIGEVPKQ